MGCKVDTHPLVAQPERGRIDLPKSPSSSQDAPRGLEGNNCLASSHFSTSHGRVSQEKPSLWSRHKAPRIPRRAGPGLAAPDSAIYLLHLHSGVVRAPTPPAARGPAPSPGLALPLR